MEREIRREKREPVKEGKGNKEESKEVERRKNLINKLSRGREDYVIRMYRTLPPEEREKIKTEVSDKFKEEFLRKLEANDREAELWYEKLKDEVADFMSRGKWEKWKRLWENQIEAAKEAAAQMTEEELKLRNLSGKERWQVWFGRLKLDELQKWKEIMEPIIKPVEEGGITEGPEKDIWEALEEAELEKKYKRERFVPFYFEKEGELEEIARMEIEAVFPGKQWINDYKTVFTEKKLGQEGREEEVEYLKQRQRRYEDAEKELERERR